MCIQFTDIAYFRGKNFGTSGTILLLGAKLIIIINAVFNTLIRFLSKMFNNFFQLLSFDIVKCTMH